MDYFENIEAYCEGRLEESAKIAFEKAMTEDQELAAAVAQYPDGKRLAEGLLEMDIMGVIEGLGEEEKSPIKPDGKPFAVKKWLIAASVIGLVTLIGWWAMKKEKKERQIDYVLAHYNAPDTSGNKSGNAADTLTMNNFEKGKRFFARRDFENSARRLEDFIHTNTHKDSLSLAHFWLGAAYLNNRNIERAEAAWENSEMEGVEMNLQLLKKQ